MKKIHVLPTDKLSRLSDCHNNKLHLDDVRYLRNYQNIYITSDEEIKEGDWCLPFYNYKVDVTEEYPIYKMKNGDFYSQDKKIILTTDQDLIKDGVQAIDDEFLEWFVKNPSCEYVDVNDWMDTNGNIAFGGNIRYQISCSTYKEIIIPKEEPKPFKDMQQLTEVDWEKFKKKPFISKKEDKQGTMSEAIKQVVNNQLKKNKL
jgi:hypothetical protein